MRKEKNYREARKIMTISPSLFIQRLKTKVESYGNIKLRIVDEHCTSVTCGGCGMKNANTKKDSEKKSSADQ